MDDRTHAIHSPGRNDAGLRVPQQFLQGVDTLSTNEPQDVTA
jgi:hypothetical protein